MRYIINYMNSHTRVPKSIVIWTVAAAVATLLVGRQFAAVPLAQAGPSIWDGVYTEAQATKGKQVYTDQCSACHGDVPTGTANAPGLAGDDFMADFNGSNMGELFSRIEQTMPANDPGNLKPEQVADLIAFMAQGNKWPAGQKELPPDADALKLIKIVKK